MARISNYLQSRLIQEFLFWSASFIILLVLFTNSYRTRPIDYFYTLLFHIPLVTAVIINSYLLIPRFLRDGKYLIYSFLLIVLYGITYGTYVFTFNLLAGWIFPGFYLIATHTALEMLGFFVIYIGITTLLEFSKSWFRELEMEKEMEILRKEKVETELKALRAQINPHFLFNSLNHIYALAVRQKPETADAVLQLSELLRYALQRMDEEQVPLADEVAYIGRYVDLYKGRFRERDRIRFVTDGSFDGYTIVPLLLIVFVENCFKHGSISRPGECIDIRLTNNDGTLTFRTENTVSDGRELPGESGGLGLENVRRRLNLLYPGRHSLEIVSDGRRFETKLGLELL